MGSYGVATQNPFGLLDNENEDPQLLAAAAKVAPAAKPAKKEAVKEEAKAPVAQGAAGGRGDAGRGDAGRGRGGRVDTRGRGRGRGGGRGFDRPSADGGEVTENGYDAAPARGEGFRGRGRGEGFRGRGGRGGRGRGEGGGDFEGRPRRDYDRRDGTGRGHEAAKRGGAGKGNWGTTGDEANQEENAEAPAEAPAEPTDAPAAEPAEAPAEDAVAEPPAEEVKEMTLDEYEKLLAEKKEALNRKAEAPSVDLVSQFTGMKALSKVDVEDEENPLELQKHKKDPKQIKEKARKEKETLQANFRVGEDPVRRGGGRGGGRGRGGDRERERPERPVSGRGRGRGGDAPPRGAAASAGPRLRTGPAPAIDDANAFPSLG